MWRRSPSPAGARSDTALVREVLRLEEADQKRGTTSWRAAAREPGELCFSCFPCWQRCARTDALFAARWAGVCAMGPSRRRRRGARCSSAPPGARCCCADALLPAASLAVTVIFHQLGENLSRGPSLLRTGRALHRERGVRPGPAGPSGARGRRRPDERRGHSFGPFGEPRARVVVLHCVSKPPAAPRTLGTFATKRSWPSGIRCRSAAARARLSTAQACGRQVAGLLRETHRSR